MRLFVSAVLLLFLGFSASAQIQVGSSVLPTLNHAGKISQSKMQDFKQTTTIFTLPYRDYKKQAEFEKAIASVWKITPFKIVPPDSLDSYMKPGYSIFSYGRTSVTKQGAPINITLSYDLWLPQPKNGNRVKKDFLSRIWMSPDANTLAIGMRKGYWATRRLNDKTLSFIYNDAVFYNWSPGLLRGYLKEVNDLLLDNTERGIFSKVTDSKALASLTKDTLFIPDYVFISYNALTGRDHPEEPELDKLKKEYPFPFKVVSIADLDQMILDGRNCKYLMFVKSSSDKFVDVYDAQTGALLYERYTSSSYNFKTKDLKRLAKEVE